MSTSSEVSLGSIRQQAIEVSDNENNGAITIPAWNSFITNSYKDLYDMLVGAYGNNYALANTYRFNTSQSQTYPLPDGTPNFIDTTGSVAAKFYKLTGVDLQYSASPNGWLTLRNFQWIQRNQFAMPNTQTNWLGYTNLRYSIQGNNLYLAPVPQAGQLVQIWYVPAPTNLQFRLQGQTTLNSNVINFQDTTGLSVGMNVYGEPVLDGSTITSIGSTSIEISSSCTATRASSLISMWTDSTLMEGISGWEKFVIFDAALNAQGKQENDTSWIAIERERLVKRIEAMAEARDIGQAFHVSDVQGANGVWDGDSFGGGYGGGSGWGGW